jgi:hypothetical protein
LELCVDELWPPGWARLKPERENFPLERPLAGPERGQIFGSNSNAQPMESLDDVDFGHVSGISTVEHRSVQRRGGNYMRLQMVVAPTGVYAETALRRMGLRSEQD